MKGMLNPFAILICVVILFIILCIPRTPVTKEYFALDAQDPMNLTCNKVIKDAIGNYTFTPEAQTVIDALKPGLSTVYDTNAPTPVLKNQCVIPRDEAQNVYKMQVKTDQDGVMRCEANTKDYSTSITLPFTNNDTEVNGCILNLANRTPEDVEQDLVKLYRISKEDQDARIATATSNVAVVQRRVNNVNAVIAYNYDWANTYSSQIPPVTENINKLNPQIMTQNATNTELKTTKANLNAAIRAKETTPIYVYKSAPPPPPPAPPAPAPAPAPPAPAPAQTSVFSSVGKIFAKLFSPSSSSSSSLPPPPAAVQSPPPPPPDPYSAYKNIPGILVQASTDGNNVCGVDGGHNIFCSSFGSTSWSTKSGLLKQISIDNGRACGVTGGNDVFCADNYNNPNWKLVPGKIMQIDLSGDNMCGVDPGNNIFCASFGKNNWSLKPGLLKQISIDGSRVCGTTGSDDVFCADDFRNPKWQLVPGKIRQIDLSGNKMCGVDGGENIFCADFNKNNWELKPGKAKNISLKGSKAYIVTGPGKVYSHTSLV